MNKLEQPFTKTEIDNLNVGDIITKEYPSHQSKEVHSMTFNKAIAHNGQYGFRNVILDNGNVLIVMRRK